MATQTTQPTPRSAACYDNPMPAELASQGSNALQRWSDTATGRNSYWHSASAPCAAGPPPPRLPCGAVHGSPHPAVPRTCGRQRHLARFLILRQSGSQSRRLHGNDTIILRPSMIMRCKRPPFRGLPAVAGPAACCIRALEHAHNQLYPPAQETRLAMTHRQGQFNHQRSIIHEAHTQRPMQGQPAIARAPGSRAPPYPPYPPLRRPPPTQQRRQVAAFLA